jgi:hypothetical protein
MEVETTDAVESALNQPSFLPVLGGVMCQECFAMHGRPHRFVLSEFLMGHFRNARREE